MPHVLVLAWLGGIAAAVWQRASRSVQTPWGDALSYLQKAVAFWHAVHEGGWFNPFDLPPTIRPPGTVLMSYPFGMTPDFHGFYFRSVYLPILSTVVAVYIASGRRAITAHPWLVAAIAVLFAALPMFYWLDWNDARWINNGWGMVDNFQAGVAALAAAAMVRTLVDRSLAWQCVCALLFCITFTIKQSGLVLMGLMGLVSLMLVVVECRRLQLERAPLRGLVRYAAGSAAIIIVVFTVFIAAAWFSNYLSSENFNWAVRALGFYKSVTAHVPLFVFHLGLGEIMPLWIASTFAIAFLSVTTWNEQRCTWGLATGSVVVWVIGLWYWIVPQGGGIQIRYFYPFVSMGLVLMVPLALVAWSRARRRWRWIGLLAAIAPAANIAALLASGDTPSDVWQYASGVSLSVGYGRDEVDEAYRFLSDVRRSGTDQPIYFFPDGTPSQFFVDVGVYEKILYPDLPSFSPRGPMDWNRGFVMRTAELVGTHFVVHRKYDVDTAADLTAPRALRTFEAEVKAFDALLSQLDERAGFRVVLDGRNLRLLEVVDDASFAEALDAFVAKHDWRPEFKAANPPTVPHWWSEQDLIAASRPVLARDVRFGDAYVVHALSVTRTNDGIKVEAWWEPLSGSGDGAPRFLFFHLVDQESALLENLQIPVGTQTPPRSDRTWRYSTVTFKDPSPGSKATAVGFGIYQPAATDGGLLEADRGRRDWGGRRVIVSLP